MSNPLIIGITGGSGSGKTTFSNAIKTHFGEGRVTVIEQDWYYRDLGHLPSKIAEKTNFDHPNAIELERLVEDVKQLKRGNETQTPRYDFSSFSREASLIKTSPKQIIVVEGLFVLHHEGLRDHIDISVFIDVPSDIRLIRRIRRDMETRGYTLEQILDFWESRSAPMYERFVSPQRKYAQSICKSLKDKTFVSAFLADLGSRLASNAYKPTIR